MPVFHLFRIQVERLGRQFAGPVTPPVGEQNAADTLFLCANAAAKRSTLHLAGQVSPTTHLKMFRLGDPRCLHGRLMHVDFFGSAALQNIASLLDFIGSPVCDQQELSSFERSLVLHHAVLWDTEAE